jgi:hypothetical protein
MLVIRVSKFKTLNIYRGHNLFLTLSVLYIFGNFIKNAIKIIFFHAKIQSADKGLLMCMK